MRVPLFIFAVGSSQICDKVNFADVDCDSYDFNVTINQNCFDQHFARGSAWNETMIFGTSGNSSCELVVADDGTNTMTIKFDECDVLTTYPNSSYQSRIDFYLDGVIRESSNTIADISTDFPFDFKCEFDGVSDIQQLESLYDADTLKINTTLIINGAKVIPAPETCAYENGVCAQNNNLKLGQKYKIDYSNQVKSSLSFRIDKIFAGKTAGDKSDGALKLVDNGCPVPGVQPGGLDPLALTYEWVAFQFTDVDEMHFTIEVDLCDPNDLIYCKGETDCANSAGNSQLFALAYADQAAILPGIERRRRSTDDDERQFRDASDITVLVEEPDDANTVEVTVNGVQIVKISEDDFTGILADGQKAAFSFAFIFFIALLF